jgi:hypothetical protein
MKLDDFSSYGSGTSCLTHQGGSGATGEAGVVRAMVARFLWATTSEGAWSGSPPESSLQLSGEARRQQARRTISLARAGLRRRDNGSLAGLGFQ